MLRLPDCISRLYAKIMIIIILQQIKQVLEKFYNHPQHSDD